MKYFTTLVLALASVASADWALYCGDSVSSTKPKHLVFLQVPATNSPWTSALMVPSLRPAQVPNYHAQALAVPMITVTFWQTPSTMWTGGRRFSLRTLTALSLVLLEVARAKDYTMARAQKLGPGKVTKWLWMPSFTYVCLKEMAWLGKSDEIKCQRRWVIFWDIHI